MGFKAWSFIRKNKPEDTVCEVSVDERQNSEKKAFKGRGQAVLFKGRGFLDPYKLSDELQVDTSMGCLSQKKAISIAAFRQCTKQLLKGLGGFKQPLQAPGQAYSTNHIWQVYRDTFCYSVINYFLLMKNYILPMLNKKPCGHWVSQHCCLSPWSTRSGFTTVSAHKPSLPGPLFLSHSVWLGVLIRIKAMCTYGNSWNVQPVAL